MKSRTLQCRYLSLFRNLQNASNIIFTLFSLLLFSQPLFSNDETCIETNKHEIGNVESKKIKVLAEITRHGREMRDNEDEITNLKREQRENPNIVRGYKLQQQLQRSNDLNKKLQNLKNRVYIIDYQIDKKKNALISCLDGVILKYEEELRKKRVKTDENFVSSLKKYKNLIQERDKIKSEKSIKLDFDYDSINISRLDGPEEILEKRDILLDWREKIDKESKSVKGRLKELEDRKKLFAQVKQFIDETYFFSEEFKTEKKTKTEDKTGKTTPENQATNKGGSDDNQAKEGDEKEGDKTDDETTDADGNDDKEDETAETTDTTVNTDTETPTDDTTPTGSENSGENQGAETTTPVATDTLNTGAVVESTTQDDQSQNTDVERDFASMKDIPFKGDLDIKRLDYIGERSIDDVIKITRSRFEKLNQELKKLDDKIKSFDTLAKER